MWQTIKPPNEVLVEVEDGSNGIIEVMAFWGRDGYRPHWHNVDDTIKWDVNAFHRWRYKQKESKMLLKDQLSVLRGELANLHRQATNKRYEIEDLVKKCPHLNMKSYPDLDFDQCQDCYSYIDKETKEILK